jgi:hypothetical protein
MAALNMAIAVAVLEYIDTRHFRIPDAFPFCRHQVDPAAAVAAVAAPFAYTSCLAIGMTQNTFEQKYEEGSRMAIAKVAGVPLEYVSYHGRFATASATPNDEAVAHFRVRTTSDTWGQRTTVRRKLLASAAANGHVFYSYMGRYV